MTFPSGSELPSAAAGVSVATVSGLEPADPSLRGTAVEAIRDAEASLVRQNSVVAHVDLQVVTAVLNAHTVHGAGALALDRLQHEIETAVLTRPDLDTPAGARSFQRYLIGKVRDIRAVVDGTSLDDTSKATLAAALASLYASTDPAAAPIEPDVLLREYGPDDLGDLGDLGEPPPPEPGSPAPDPGVPAAAAPTAPASAPGLPMWGGGSGATPPLASALGNLPESWGGRLRDPAPQSEPDAPPSEPEPEPEPGDGPADGDDDARVVELPDGGRIVAPTAQLAEIISAAIGGTPIAEAFAAQGITIAPPGSAVDDPVEAAGLLAGDIGFLADRHALALGDGTAVLDGRIQPIGDVSGPGFLGWRHPPAAQTGED